MTPMRTTESFTLHSVWLNHWSVTESASFCTSTTSSGPCRMSSFVTYGYAVMSALPEHRVLRLVPLVEPRAELLLHRRALHLHARRHESVVDRPRILHDDQLGHLFVVIEVAVHRLQRVAEQRLELFARPRLHFGMQ